MSRWFRFYDDAINDPKILKLSDKLHRVWIGILCIASKNNGELPSLDDMALMIRMKPEKLAEAIESLADAGLIDTEGMISSPHNWSARQYKSDSSAERMKRHRDKKRDVTVTVQRQNTETDNRTEQKERSRADAPSDDWPKDCGDQFWQAYPRKTEKLAAMKKLASVRKSGVVTFADLMAGVKRYAESKPDPKYTKHPTTWLNAGCWADEVQTGGGNGNGTHNASRRSGSADFFAGIASVAADIAGNGEPPRDANQEIPRGRVNIEH